MPLQDREFRILPEKRFLGPRVVDLHRLRHVGYSLALTLRDTAQDLTVGHTIGANPHDVPDAVLVDETIGPTFLHFGSGELLGELQPGIGGVHDREHVVSFRLTDQCVVPRTTSTRRFLALPESVSFEATGTS